VADARGGGSVFLLRVPVEIPADASTPPAPPSAGSAATIGGAWPVQRALQHLLRAEGFSLGDPAAAALRLVHTAAADPAAAPAAARVVRFGPGSALDGTLTAAALHAVLTGTLLASPDPPPGLWQTAALAPLQLLIADDDPINREIAASLLRHLGHIVTVASDGAEALTTARARAFDCILLDLHMPGLDGVELARALRRLPGPVAATRLVAVTADVDAATRAAVSEAGFDAIVTKPVTLERLAAALPARGAAVPAPPAMAPPAPGEAATIDLDARTMLATRLAPDRFAALVRTFWEELARSLEQPGGLGDHSADRRLHSRAGSSGSLGYAALAVAARHARACFAKPADLPDAIAALHAALAAALVADAALVPDALGARIAAALAAPPAAVARFAVGSGAQPVAATAAQAPP